ncbi:hypothetical protein ACFLX3_04500 [Chloroflexota bacterium]
MSSEPQFKRLRVYNIFMGFLHLAQAIVIIVLSNNFTLPITTSFVTYKPVMLNLRLFPSGIYRLSTLLI